MILRTLAISVIDAFKRLVGIRTPETTGTPDLTAADRVDVDGTGDRFSGSFEVDSISHQGDDAGYDENIEAERNSTGDE